MTEDEAQQLITRLLGTRNQIALYPFEFGWGAQEILSPDETAQGMHIGQGNFIIDKTGVVTVHSSLPLDLIMEEYAETRRRGQIMGEQVWPEPTDPTPSTRMPTT